MKRIPHLVLVVLIATQFLAAAQTTPLTAQEILDRVNAAWRGDSFHGVISLEITLGGQLKTHRLEVWTLGDELAMVRVLAPEIDADSGYLQRGDELWYYTPAAGVIKLPAIAIGDALFGAGPSLEDISHGTLSEEYDVSVQATDSGYFLTLLPHESAPVVYGKLELWAASDFILEKMIYYDQRGDVLQTATFSDVVVLTDRRLPTTIRVEDAFGDQTLQHIEVAQFDVELDAQFFSFETFDTWRTNP